MIPGEDNNSTFQHMETDGGLAPTGWFTSVVSFVREMNLVNVEDAQSSPCVSRARHPGLHSHPLPRVHQPVVRPVPGDSGDQC